MTAHFDAEETRKPAAREAALLSRLPAFIAYARGAAPGWGRHLREIGVGDISSREPLAALPLLRKSDLPELQRSDPPFGGLVTRQAVARIMVSPGPIHEPQAAGPYPWRMARALFAAGFRTGDLVHNAFAYHLTPAGFMLDEAARALGCTIVPATGNTEQQAEAAIRLGSSGYVSTPDFLRCCSTKRLDWVADRVKRWAARWLVRVSLIAGIDPPDFSLGMGQIKLSTLTKLRDQAKSRGEAVEMPAPLELVEQLEDWCKGQDLGVQLVSRLYGVRLGDDRLIPRSEILRAAALWNGQGRSARIEAVIANARYRELVYETMVALRFAQQSGSAH